MTPTESLAVAIFAVFAALACGGTVELQKHDEPSNSSGTSAGTLMFAGGTLQVPSGGSGGSYIPSGGSDGRGMAGYVGTPGEDDAVIGGGALPSHGVLAYDADRDGAGRSIYVSSIDTPSCTQRVTSPAAQAKHAAFSPDGSMLAYASRSSGVYQIHVLHLASGKVEAITEAQEGATYPAFSPDSSQLAFVTGDPETFYGNPNLAPGDLMLADLATRVPRLLRAAADGGSNQQFYAPIFSSPDEILVSDRNSMVGVNIESRALRQVVPITNRIPRPEDPAPAPDGLRYAFSDYCGPGGPQLFIARIDGSTGDTCNAALTVAPDYSLASADWGSYGYIVAEVLTGSRGIMLIDDKQFSASLLESAPAGRNPAWAPKTLDLAIACD